MVGRWILPPACAVACALGCALVVGGAWWWAVLRLLLVPEHTGAVEGTVAAGGWGLSLLPVHAAASRGKPGRGRRGQGAEPGDRGSGPSGQGVGPDWQRGHQ
ncbi:hypothetical protein [Streptomyces sp. NPDC059134]|uniref:hypothetical protein n=1 Tax=Streptomyces sp. NPDC059134 TaxID=3346738 RepID=UPI0036A5FD92